MGTLWWVRFVTFSFAATIIELPSLGSLTAIKWQNMVDFLPSTGQMDVPVEILLLRLIGGLRSFFTFISVST
jgi:hypothetical protein